jgi:hypothetical protein
MKARWPGKKKVAPRLSMYQTALFRSMMNFSGSIARVGSLIFASPRSDIPGGRQ